MVPLRSASGVEGVLALAWVPERLAFHAVDADLPARFAEQAALAIQVDPGPRGPATARRSSRTATGSAATCTTW